MAEPTSIQAKRAQVAQIERELAAIDGLVGKAAEAHNGARWRLSVVQERIAENGRNLALATRNLGMARSTLVSRVRQVYKVGGTSTAELLLSSGSLVSAIDRVNLLKRVERQDAKVVVNIRGYRERARVARKRLLKDRGRARTEVAKAAEAKKKVAALLRRRQAVLSQARGELGRLLAAEQARQRRQAEIARQQALAAQRAAAAQSPQTIAPAGTALPAVSPEQAAAAPLPSGSGNGAAVGVAMQFLGTPYRWGGASPSSGFDCSGLASYAYAQIGKSVPHYTGAIYSQFPKVPRDQLQAGDMIFFNGLGHMGIYIGGGKMVHAPRTGDVVKVSDIGRSDYVGAVRP